MEFCRGRMRLITLIVDGQRGFRSSWYAFWLDMARREAAQAHVSRMPGFRAVLEQECVVQAAS